MAEQRAYVRTYKYCSCVSQKKMTKLEEVIVGTAGGMYVRMLVSKQV